MWRETYTLSVTLDGEYAAKLALLAARSQVEESTLAGSLLSSALDATDLGAETVAAMLDGIPGAYEQAQLGHRQALAGLTVPLDDLEGRSP
jgi:hypothetical protein